MIQWDSYRQLIAPVDLRVPEDAGNAHALMGLEPTTPCNQIAKQLRLRTFLESRTLNFV